MTPEDIAAYIGAAAWVPQIVTWINGAVAKPKLRIISAPTVSIGFSNLGPTVNLTASISADRRDALIEELSLKATHEKGEVRVLKWKWLNEPQGQIEIPIPTAPLMQFSKQQPAIALKVTTSTLENKEIWFEDTEFGSRWADLTLRVMEQHDYLKQQPGDATEAVLKSKEFLQARDFFNDSMYWKVGRYDFDISVLERRLRTPHTQRFKVILSKAEIENLRRNCANIEAQIRAEIQSKETQSLNVVRPTYGEINPAVIAM
ncbi:MAG: hypothetical protein ACLQOO_07265 [Terriglobia bacterium]